MLLSVAFPKQEEADNVMQDAHYLVNRRGGFTAGYNEKPVKKQTTWMLASGSVFHSRFDGIILNVAGSSPHPVWRCGKTLMMGVKAI